MNRYEENYLNLLDTVLSEGDVIEDRTGTGTHSIFDTSVKVDLTKEPFPILQCRRFLVHQPIVEMIGFIRGITNAKWYNDNGCPFWNKFGLPENVIKQIPKDDGEMINEFCSYDGVYQPTDTLYLNRFKQLSTLSYQDGQKLMGCNGIAQYKDMVVAKKGDLGPIYGHMWRHWPCGNGVEFDQLKYAYEELKLRPYNRRIVVNGWNPSVMPDFNKKPYENVPDGNVSLMPCHVLHTYVTSPISLEERIDIYNERVTDIKHFLSPTDKNIEIKLKASNIPKYYLNLFWYQRSWDLVLGGPANMVGYASLLKMMAKLVNMVPKEVSCHATNVHIYNDHIDGVKEILRRGDAGLIPESKTRLILDPGRKIDMIDNFEARDFTLVDYNPLEAIKFPIAL